METKREFSNPEKESVWKVILLDWAPMIILTVIVVVCLLDQFGVITLIK
jgi:hypothetical protein